ncbi:MULTISPECIES: hypothetical protein [unclassified Halomonas]|uniref:hypothetical protein n=1 Tax=unclassified Halomonas TaxID=2609666 RepID=UPI0007D97FAE|nr:MULTISPECIES: hypothetical protein [unclassified Halomonas]MBT2788370.1 hypothetical protein [Halomonas sp. ISL-106]MBT2797961.1 hypothetical protein [Halomonas sp. ISL-104]OAL60534.1 hypothetical protein A6R74_17545 [Halomonas sp. ALS9]
MIEELRKKLKTLALLDAVIEQEWQYRYFSYNSHWSDSEEMGSLRDGCGGEWFLWISGDLAGYKCLSPEDGLMPDLKEAIERVPSAYENFITEPAFSMNQATCIWFLKNSKWVKYGRSVKSLIDLEAISTWMPNDYCVWAAEHYEREIDLGATVKIFKGEFSEEIAQILNPKIVMSELLAELSEIGVS